MSGVRTFVSEADVWNWVVGTSRELRRKMDFRRTEIAGSDKETYVNFGGADDSGVSAYLEARSEVSSNRLPLVSRELSRRENYVSIVPIRHI